MIEIHPRVGVLGSPGYISIDGLNSWDLYEKVGHNTGNLMFQYASNFLVDNHKVFIDVTDASNDWDAIRNSIDILYLPCANQINKEFDLTWWNEVLRIIDKPIVAIGLGAQSQNLNDLMGELNPSVIDFLNILKSKAIAIGVRGAYTKKIAQNFGLSNVFITGCPSNFLNSSVSGSGISAKIKNIYSKSSEVKINYLLGTLEEYVRSNERSLFAKLGPNVTQTTRQTNISTLRIIRGDVNDDDLSNIEWERLILRPEMPFPDYCHWLKETNKFYFNAQEWISSSSAFDLTVGMRIHGAVAAIQGNSLGVCVAFDSRTMELVDSMGYPYLFLSDIDLISKDNLVDLIHFDSTEFSQKRDFLYENFQSIFRMADFTSSTIL